MSAPVKQRNGVGGTVVDVEGEGEGEGEAVGGSWVEFDITARTIKEFQVGRSPGDARWDRPSTILLMNELNPVRNTLGRPDAQVGIRQARSQLVGNVFCLR